MIKLLICPVLVMFVLSDYLKEKNETCKTKAQRKEGGKKKKEGKKVRK